MDLKSPLILAVKVTICRSTRWCCCVVAGSKTFLVFVIIPFAVHWIHQACPIGGRADLNMALSDLSRNAQDIN